jgi:hypothetical protein
MTCKEKLALEHPDKLSFNTLSGCVGCPDQYGYLDKPADNCGLLYGCERCWNREIPGSEPVKLDLAASGTGVALGTIKDSGDRTEFETGAVRDMREGKGRCDLMPLEVVAEFFGDGTFIFIERFKRDSDTMHLRHALEAFMEKAYDGPYTMLLEVAKHFEEGAKKYGENNWQKGIPVKCYIDSAVRHYLKWLRGDKDEPHDRAFVWNLMCCIWEVDYREKEEAE